MLPDDLLQRMYELGLCLHDDQGTALAVTLEAYERLTLIRRLQERRTGHYRLRLPEACLPQYCVYLASDAREREQECPQPGPKLRYQPTPDDWLVRYVKTLVWWTMDRNPSHVPVALGCFLYGYQPSEIAHLAPEIFDQHNIRRIKRRLAQQIHARFQRTPMFLNGHHTLRTHPPTTHDRQLVHHALTLFAPWGCPHVPAPAGEQYLLETYFNGVSSRSDWDRIHALIDPACAGLSQLVREYNETFPQASQARLEDPEDNLAIPCFVS